MNALSPLSLQPIAFDVNATRDESLGICALLGRGRSAQTVVSGVGQRRAPYGPTSHHATAVPPAASGVASSRGPCDPWQRGGVVGPRDPPDEPRNHRGRSVHGGDLRGHGDGGTRLCDVSRDSGFDPRPARLLGAGSQVRLVSAPDGGSAVGVGVSGLRPDLVRLLMARPTRSRRGKRPYRQSTISSFLSCERIHKRVRSSHRRTREDTAWSPEPHRRYVPKKDCLRPER